MVINDKTNRDDSHSARHVEVSTQSPHSTTSGNNAATHRRTGSKSSEKLSSNSISSKVNRLINVFNGAFAHPEANHDPTSHHDAKRGLEKQDEPLQEILPFSLLGDGLNIPSLLQGITRQYQLGTTTIQDAYPCTPFQEGLFLLSFKRSGEHTMQTSLELSPSTSLDDFRSAWEEVVRHTPILRTRAIQHDTLGLMQLVVDEGVHWAKSNNLEDYLDTDKKRAIELGQPLSRYGLVEDKTGPRWFIWTTHTSIYDQQLQALSFNALNQAYAGQAIEERTSFQHFINYVKDQEGQKMSDYWKTSLNDCEAMPFPALPAVIEDSSADSTTEHVFSLPKLPADLTASTLIRGGWALLTGRLTNSTDIVFGTTATGRGAPVANIDGMMGPTTTIVPTRISVAGERAVSDYLASLQQQAIDDIPFEQAGLHHIAKISSDCQQACKFQTLLAIHLEDELLAETKVGKWKNIDQHKLYNMYALVLHVNISKSDSVRVTASFDSRVIEPWLVQTLLTRLEWSTHQLLHAEQGQRLVDLDLSTKQDLETIWGWNREVPAPTNRTILDILEEKVSAQPDAPAIHAWDGNLTYQELHNYSDRLARHLSTLDVASKFVPLFFEKSMWTPIAMFAVLKAGGTFVLLDPSLPKQRLQIVLKQINAGVLLASLDYQSLGTELCDTVVTVGPDTFAGDDNTKAKETRKPDPESIAYVVFTSGTTGTPKGSMVTHRSVATGISVQSKALGFNSESRVYDFSTYGFDVNIWDLFHTLSVGGCLCVPSDEDRKNDLAGSINSLAANTISMTPSLSRMLSPQQVPQIHTVMFVAEALYLKDVEPWWGQVRLLNGYGPSECTPFSIFNYDTATPEELTRIGKGCGTITWIVDAENHNRLLPPGSVGELLLEGPLIGPGYLNEPEKNAAAYAQDPVWLTRGTPGHLGRQGRLYKTGDLVRYNEDGSLSFVGRKDEQVKIRGQRIELLEVEHHIQEAMPEVAQVVAQVIVPKGDNASPELVAFILMHHDVSRTAEDVSAQLISIPTEVEESLSQHLPTYMVPRTFFSVQKMPIGASGKLNRRKLREIGGSFTNHQLAEMRTAGQGPKQQPTSEAERRMQKIWFDVLGLSPGEIGVNDSFFKLGGNSIDAMKVVAEARKIGLELKMADVFQQPRLHHVANRAISNEVMSQNIPKHRMKSHVKQSFAQGRLWFMEQLYPGLSWYIMPFVMRLRGGLQLDALEQALHALETRHETLRTTFDSQNNVNIQVVQPVRPRGLELVEIPVGQEGLLEEMLEKDASTPFKLDREPGWRVKIYRLGSDSHVLSAVMHHIISDGWSVDVLHRELATFYSAALRGQDPLSQVEPLPIQYQDYSVWQQKMAQVDEHERQLEYWVKQLETSQPAELLLDKPRPTTLTGKAGVQRLNIDGQLYQNLQQFCQEYQTTPFIVLLSAFRATHFRLTGQVDATIGSPNANRVRWELKDMIGFFVNMQCLRTTIGEEDETFEQLVKQVQSVTVASFSNQDVPFERLVSKLRTSRDLSRHPLVQIVFAVHSQQNLGQLSFEGIDCEVITSEPTTRFDMECHFFQETDSLRGEILYSTDLYDDSTISSMVSIFNKILEQGIKNPKASVASFSLMTESDHALLESWGLDKVDEVEYPRESSVVDIFRQQVQLCPDKMAVKDSSTQLTYTELDTQSDHLAAWLAGKSFKPETPVGVFASRSCETIVAFFGILKANLAYLPLDTRMSNARLETLLSCLKGDKLVLVGSEQEAIRLGDDVEFVQISKILNETHDISQKLTSTSLPSATSLAYIMFTSGSTGKPKGVMIEHRSIVRLVKESNFMQHVPSAPIMAHISNIAFDGSTWEIYGALLNGGTLICMDTMTVLDSKLMSATFAHEGVQTGLITTALFKQYVHECPSLIASFETIFVGGERLDPQALVAANKIMKGKFIHAYGPTENTSYSTTYVTSKDETYIAEVPIGRSVSNSGAHVMDSQQKLVPVGVVGELVLTGDGLARGYTDPERDIDRFVSVNIGSQEIRAYRTGDYVRYRPRDGQLEFLGRLDGQIKIRGQRVELGEIEHAIRTHPIVQDAVVVVQQDGGDDPQLSGFVTLNDFVDEVEGESVDESAENDNDQHVQVWEGHFEGETYADIDKMSTDKVGRDFIGWTSMYDGDDIDKEEMSEWLDDTISGIRNGKEPGNVLEIGSGTGMILFNLVDGLKNYVGLDPSASAVELITKLARSMPDLAGKVQMYKGTAADVNRLDKATKPNLVVINSVAQYFPSQAYLVKMIKDVLQFGSVEQIHFGDMRSYALYRQFLVTRAIRMLGENVDLDMLRQKMTAMEEAELEFLVDPGFFTSLPEMMPDLIDHVEILPKRMRATNELSAYRYAAVVHAKIPGKEQQTVHDIGQEQWIDFQEGGLDRGSLLQHLQSHSDSSTVAVSNIPYEKTIFERFVVDILANNSAGTVAIDNWYSSALQDSSAVPSLAAIDLAELAQQTGFAVEISCARQYSQKGGLDVIFHHEKSTTGMRTLFRFPTDHQGRLSKTLSTRPVEQQMRQNVRTQVLEMLQSQLPSYMVPRLISVLNSLPVNENGKIDRRALVNRVARPTIVRMASTSTRELNSETERQLQEIWADVLNLDRATIGLDGSFFHLGGNSISAMKVVGKARSVGLQLSVADMFRHPTLEMMAGNAIPIVDESQDVATFSLLPESVELESFLKDIAERYSLADKIEDVYPCTPLQEGLLAWSSTRPGDYILQSSMKVALSSSIEQTKSLWEQVFELFPILRTRVIPSDNGLLQVVSDEKIKWNKATSLEKYLESDRHLPMEFGQPLTRFALIENAEDDTQWVAWTIHHALYDGWSLSLIQDAMARISDGKPVMRGPKFTSFIKHIRENNDQYTKDYWCQYLGGYHGAAFPALQKQMDRPKTDTIITHRLPRVQVQKPGLNVTESTVIRAAWALIAGQMTNSDDVAFGETLFGRNAPVANIERMVAPTFTTVPVRIKINKEQKIWDYLLAVQKQSTEMIPFEQTGLQRIAKLSVDCQNACEFQTQLVIQTESAMKEEVSSLQNQDKWFNPYALVIDVELGSDEHTAKVGFDSRVLEPWVVRKLMERMENLVEQFNSFDQDQTVNDIQSLTPRDLQQIWQWNKSVPESVERLVHDMVLEQTLAQPDATAIHAWDGTLTYKELDTYATLLAAKLMRLGVKQDQLLPLCFHKSMWTTVAMLGVIKAGGAFVLLDPSLPEQRLESIVEQTGSSLILSSTSNLDLCPRLSKTVIELGPETLNTLDLKASQTVLSQSSTQQSASTMILAVFTSGSTGVPKGITHTHASLASGLKHQPASLGFKKNSRVFDFASYAFDASPQMTFAALVTGACICVPSETDRRGEISGAMSRMQVTLADLTPSVARLLDPATLPDLETLVLSGEAVSAEDAARWFGEAWVVNAYGPAECIIGTINSDAIRPGDAASIGKGAGMVTWVVDPDNHNRLLPPGCTGELLLEGPVLGSGYINEPDRTAAAFIKDPTWLTQGTTDFIGRGGRLYKTGDLVRYSEDGNLWFVARKDAQVKIRGQRVELGEIELRVQECIPGAERVIADVLNDEASNSPILAAFIQTDQPSANSGDGTPTILRISEKVETKLAESLPKYMLPTVYFNVSEIPKTATGKTDRKRLREIGQSSYAAMGGSNGQHHVGTKDPIFESEQPAYALAGKVLSMRPSWGWDGVVRSQSESGAIQVGFADVLLHSCGLDSLNTMSLLHFITRQFNVRVNLRTLIDRTTSIRGLAQLVSELQQATTSPKTTNGHALTQRDFMAEVNRHDSRIAMAQQLSETQTQQLTVFLTGANGFIGTQILRQLLEHHQVKQVIALVRGETAEAARQRTISAATKALWWTQSHEKKLQVWKGDLSLPQFGLDKEHWRTFSEGETINAIIHNGAVVHWGKTYDALEATNVGSTVELLHLAVSQPSMRFVYVSGGIDGVSSDEPEETLIKMISSSEETGYSQTKFVAEAVVRRAAKRNTDPNTTISVLRPGLVVGTPEEGVSNADDFMWRLAAACIQAGVYNADGADDWIEVSDVATVAKKTIDTALNRDADREIVVPVRDGMASREFCAILVDMGYKLTPASSTKWMAAIQKDMEASKEKHPLWPVAHMLHTLVEQQPEGRQSDSSEDERSTSPRLKAAVRKSVEFLAQVGFFPLPGGMVREDGERGMKEAFSRSGLELSS